MRSFIDVRPGLSLFRWLKRSPPASPWEGRAPIREELFSVERIEQHARSLAKAQTVTARPIRGYPLAGRLAENGAVLLAAYRGMVAVIEEGGAITPAAEWLIDNYYVIERQIREIQSNLPPGYYRQLPKLAMGPFAGYPRVLGMAWAFVAHGDSRFDPAMLIRYVRAYQEIQPLTIGELWAVSITFRMVLIENLRRVAQQILEDRAARQQANGLADLLLESEGSGAEPVADILAAHDGDNLTEAFALQLVHRLRDQDPRITPALTWLDRRLAAQGMTVETVVHDGHRRLGAANVTVRNIITSLRLISDIDWNEIVESISLADDALAADGGIFRAMDFPTRNLYRTAVEDLARRSGRSELDVTHAAILAAKSPPESVPEDERERRSDPGYHLLAGGRHAFSVGIGCRPQWRHWPAHLIRVFGIGGYAVITGLVALTLLALPLLALWLSGLGLGGLGLLGVLGLIPAVDAAVALVNRAVTFWFGASLLPGMELEHGIPAALRTIVVVPTLLTSSAEIEDQIERLEIHHLASPDGEIYYALLSDWTDSATEQAEGDEALLAVAVAGIDRLNSCHPPTSTGPRFLLFHRRRVWNEGEQRWMGWERKRGKLHELNQLLRGGSETNFIVPSGASSQPPADIRYVITLDSDTKLLRDTVRRLLGKMAHPLNRPRFDAATGRVVEGYALLQPRVTPSLPIGREGSVFQRIFSSLGGISPYAAAVSDVYQDLFGEGSYVGKGIYDIDAFEAALAGRVPDSTLLSHDLFEGVFARAGLASDVEVVEEFPARYDVDALRHHRWARGDWQLLPWILGAGPTPSGRDRKVDILPAIGRWKMLDNLRSSLSAPATILALLAGWTLSFEAALIWTGFILATIVVPALIPVVAAIPPSRAGITFSSHLRALGDELRLSLALSVLIVSFRAHQACLMSDAIARTVWRLFFSRRHLLEWVTAAQSSQGPRPNSFCIVRRMAGAPVIAMVTLAGAGLFGQGSWMVAAPVALLWFVSPLVARWVSLSAPVAGRLPVSDSDAHDLRLTARRTWRYFESVVTAADHWLPPDNFQEDPAPVLARRTSPTNIGLYLLSVVSARDFGWIGTDEAASRLQSTLATISGMEHFRGHLYNWYDTGDLHPLEPKYVSSVDSGNLAGHLIALANACREWRTLSLDPAQCLAGLGDALDLAREAAASLRDGPRPQTVTWSQFDDALAVIAAEVRHGITDRGGFAQLLPKLAVEAETVVDIARALVIERGGAGGGDLLFWGQACVDAVETHRRDIGAGADTLIFRLATIEQTARAMALAMEFGFLFDRERMLLSIGYLVPEGTLDPNCYDLLASEARLASFIAIAKGDIPARHWFRLGRIATPVAYSAALVSWSGSMFEYLMPALVMRAPAGSLLEQTSRLVVRRQIDYAANLDLPWGMSESAYNARDLDFTYQYSNFGIPSLGLKRGLGKNRVVAPYATALATMVDPRAASANLERLAKIGARGRYGFYEALDYTPSRLPEGESVTIVRAYMAHHQGMSIVAIADTLFDGAMRTRFHAEPIIQATELLLQERMPRDVSVAHPWAAEVNSDVPLDTVLSGGRSVAYANQATPATLLLSNGHLTTMITASGSGQIRWGDLALTRWREDSTCDDCGSYVFLRDGRSGEVWSPSLQPSGTEPDQSEIAFYEDRAEFSRRDGALTTTMTVLVSSEGDAEVRRVSITNGGNRTREIDATSYVELALAPQAADIAHPAFSKLFVETESLAAAGALLATRRRRSPDEPEVWAAHLAVVEKGAVGTAEFETDRARFLGRGRTPRTALAVIDGRPLSNTVGTVLDPIFSLRHRVRVAPGETVRIAFWTMAAHSREEVLNCVDKHRDDTAFARAATLARTQAQVQLHHLGITAAEAGLFQRLAGHVVHVAPTLRPSSDTIRRGAGPQSGLWPQGISGDLPILLLRIHDTETISLAREVLLAHEYWRMKRFAVDLVILNEHPSSYVQDLQTALDTLVRTNQPRSRNEGDVPSPGRVFVLRADLIPPATTALLLAVARVVLSAQRGSLFEQLDRRAEARDPGKPRPARSTPSAVRPSAQDGFAPAWARIPPPPKLEFFNGLGGFAAGGTEYVTILGPGQTTPAPWINVVANPGFGFLASAEGGGHSWAINSRENQLTPWSNDPVGDRPGEVIYLHDEESGELWSPTALPIRDKMATYLIHHGRGYSRFELALNGIAADLVQTVPLDDPVKISRLVLRNLSGRPRRIGVTAYVEWVLGTARSATLPFVSTEIDSVTGAMLARNPWRADFGERVAFLDLGGRQTQWTGDRREFIGRNRTLAAPAALTGSGPWSNKTGAGLDPCGALRTTVELAPGASVEILILLGETANAEEARSLIVRTRAADPAVISAATAAFWNDALGSVQVKTPDRSMDIMLNGWLLYQTIACRLWARSGFYQASGAYGFRDQLQDGMALTGTRPDMTREHLLRAAARQFIEGDVQHWWLPHSGQGVRTRISDDRVWLAVAVGQYVSTTGDRAVLDVPVPFLEGQTLAAGAHDCFFLPTPSEDSAPLFEHCALALDHSLGLGVHGLPLIGTGDWNDGMNRVGERGQGESIWLGWLLFAALTGFAPLAEARGEAVRAAAWRAHAAALRESLDREAWDGAWYLRGFFDDGTKLGSAAAEECRIDSIAQSWAVLSGAADPERAACAMKSVERELIRPADELALLFAPPFDRTPLDPGYIKGYPPGIRENGGQYTHAALWSVMALAALGHGDKAAGLFALLNPINHARTRASLQRYKVEPYVVAADVYAVPPHVGRGGWTWYSGSAAWMQRAGIESILGLRREGDRLCLDPCIPRLWSGFSVTWRHGSARYEIEIENPDGAERGIVSAILDDIVLEQRPVWIPLRDDGCIHRVRVRLGLS